MKEWYSASELAGLIGLPGTKMGLLKKAVRESWLSREREGQGGGSEYHLSSFPPETQKSLRISYAKRQASRRAGMATAEELLAAEREAEAARIQRLDQGLRDYMKLRGDSRTRADAKSIIVLAAEEFFRDSGLSGTTGRDAFVRGYNLGDIRLDDGIHGLYPKLSVKTLYNWMRKYDQDGIASLAGKYGKHRKGTGVIDSQGDLEVYVVGMIVEHPHIKVSVLYKAMQAHFADLPVTLPGENTLGRWVRTWKAKNAQIYTAVTNPDAWKNKYMAAPGSASERADGLNSLWEFDATPADVMLTDGRHAISGVIDVYSRRLKLIVTRTSNAKSVANVIRAAILDWGVPEIAKTDNGADYKSQHIQTVFKRLHIEQEFCPPFQGWRKPHIERAFKTFAHDIAELLPGFIGHNVDERKAIESRKSFSDRLFEKDSVIDVAMSSADLQAFCDTWVETVYHRDHHSGLGKTPIEVVRAWAQPIRRIEDERVLDVLLSEPAGTRTITKKGIKLDNGLYIHQELWARAGEEVHVYYDDKDMGSIYVYDCDGEFICIAEDPDITGVSRGEVAAKAKEVQREAVQEERRRLKAAARQVTKRDVAQQILDHRLEQARAEKTIEFPKRSVEHTGDGIEAAKDALWFVDGNQGEPVTQETQPSAAQQLAEIITLTQSPKQEEETEQQRYERWLMLDKHVSAGETLEGREAIFHRTYQQTPEFETYRDLIAMGILQLHG